MLQVWLPLPKTVLHYAQEALYLHTHALTAYHQVVMCLCEHSGKTSLR